MLTITPRRYRDLTPLQRATWIRIQEADRAFRSPCFRPEFVAAVDAVRDDVEVAVFEQEGRPVGFLPYERRNRGRARPVAGKLSDFHGGIVSGDVGWTAERFLSGCGLASFDFDHLVAGQRSFDDRAWARWDSWAVDLRGGFDDYCRERRASSASRFRKIESRGRKLEREVGPLRFTLDDRDPAAFDSLMRWKRGQYHDTGVADVLSHEWAAALVRRVLQEKETGFRGLLLTLRAGDALVAVDLCLASHGVLQSWFPAYDRAFADYSPGHVLLLETARRAADGGLHRIELGRGTEDYKRLFANDTTPLVEGAVDLRPVVGSCRHVAQRLVEWARRSRLRNFLRVPGRFIRRWSDQAALS